MLLAGDEQRGEPAAPAGKAAFTIKAANGVYDPTSACRQVHHVIIWWYAGGVPSVYLGQTFVVLEYDAPLCPQDAEASRSMEEDGDEVDDDESGWETASDIDEADAMPSNAEQQQHGAPAEVSHTLP